ncbi:MAG: glycosyltransferase, partial [Arcobacteraceae bacterium]|nr:glycosyltransferase [Arcobacteraceae bacterium]
IDENKFIIALIGARLSAEMTDDFIKTVLFEIVSRNSVQILLIGGFDKFDTYSEAYPEFKNNFLNLGYQDDILAVLDHCNLVINPPRSGGGSSAAEALYKGVPVVTLKFGDVFINVGVDFAVDSLTQMGEMVNQYIHNKEFYFSQSHKAKDRAKILMDSQNELEILLNKIYSNPLFR